MSDERLRIRIDSEAKHKAMARAKEQGITLSEAVRDLLLLWCAGQIDLQALRASYGTDTYHEDAELPTREDLHALGGELDALVQAINAARDRLAEFAQKHDKGLAMAETFRENDEDWQWRKSFLGVNRAGPASRYR